MTVFAFTAERYLKASGPRDKSISVAWADPGLEASPLKYEEPVNAEYVLFADRRTAAQVPGVADLAPMFSPLSGTPVSWMSAGRPSRRTAGQYPSSLSTADSGGRSSR